MLRYCYSCGATHTIGTRCPTQTPWAGPKVSRIRRAIYQRDHATCQECGLTITFADSHVDHITPHAMGGTDHPGNLRLTCTQCNLAKGCA